MNEPFKQIEALPDGAFYVVLKDGLAETGYRKFDDIKALAAEVERLKKESLEDKTSLQEMFCVIEGRPDYEKGWNDAIEHAIQKFGRGHLFHENGRLLDVVERLKAALERIRDQDCPWGDCSCRNLHNIAREALKTEENNA